MYDEKKKKKTETYMLCKAIFSLYKIGFTEVYMSWTCEPNVCTSLGYCFSVPASQLNVQ